MFTILRSSPIHAQKPATSTIWDFLLPRCGLFRWICALLHPEMMWHQCWQGTGVHISSTYFPRFIQQLQDGKFVAFTFVWCDTGAPDYSTCLQQQTISSREHLYQYSGQASSYQGNAQNSSISNFLLTLLERLRLSPELEGGFSFRNSFDFF